MEGYAIRTCIYSDHEKTVVHLQINQDEDTYEDYEHQHNDEPNENEIPYNDIHQWIEKEIEDVKFKGNVKICYRFNEELQDLFDINKEEYDYILPEYIQDAYLFSNVEDMNRFMKYWRQTKNVKNINAILFEDEDHIIRTFNLEAK